MSSALATQFTPEELAKFASVGERLAAEEGWEERVLLTHHAKQRAHERLGLQENQATKVLRDVVKNGTYIGEVVGEEDEERSHHYTKEGKIAVVSMDKKYIVTCWNVHYSRRNLPEWMLTKFIDIAKAELRKLYREESRWLKDIGLIHIECLCDIYLSKRVLMTSKSKRKLAAAELMIETAEQRLQSALDEIKTIQDKIRQTAKSLATFL